MTDSQKVAGYDGPASDGAPDMRHDQPGALPVTSSPELRTLVAVAVAAMIVAALYVAQDIFIPITLAVTRAVAIAWMLSTLAWTVST